MEIYLFAIVQLVNVIISTIKSIATIKASAKVAAIINAVSYTIGAVITYCIAKQNLLIVIPITFICNLTGVYLGRILIDKVSKDKLWVYNSTFKCYNEEDVIQIKAKLKEHNIDSYYVEVIKDQLYDMKIFAHTKSDSDHVKSLLKSNKIKYYIVETI